MAAVSAALEAVVDAPVIGEVRADEPLWPQEALGSGWVLVDVLEDLPLGLVRVSAWAPSVVRVAELVERAWRLVERRSDGAWRVPLQDVGLRVVWQAGPVEPCDLPGLGEGFEVELQLRLWGV